MTPLVSVLIPTYRRPDLVARALRCALQQTLRELEVVVIVDGRDAETVQTLREVDDPRLRVIVPEQHLGNSAARNLGVAEARGTWVAFLDDDDEWDRRKLELQLHAAQRSRHPLPIVACHLVARAELRDHHWPRRIPAPSEPISEYLFCRKSPFNGEGLVVTSALFAMTRLLREIPFDSTLQKYVDLDWLLRATRRQGVGVEFVDDTSPLVIWHIERNRARITNRSDWVYSLNYARSHRELFTRRSYAAFVLHVVSFNASRQGAWLACVSLLAEALRHGRPSVIDLASHVGNFIVPESVRGRVAGWVGRRPAGAVPVSPRLASQE